MEIVVTKKSGSIIRHGFHDTKYAAKWTIENCKDEGVFHFQGTYKEYDGLWRNIEEQGGLK